MSTNGKPPDCALKYTSEQRAAALAALASNQGDLRRTSAEIAIPYSTLRSWASGKNIAAVQARRDSLGAMGVLADKCEELALTIAFSINRQTIKRAGLKERASSLGLLIDKCRLMRGEASKVTEHRGPAAGYDYGKLTTDQLSMLLDLLERCKVNEPSPAPIVVNAGPGSHVHMHAPDQAAPQPPALECDALDDTQQSSVDSQK